ncbi:MAG: FAD:protein FMN transferase [Phycisphaerales bacterium]|nr:MAG: FAD:protein FMN transferase [Phycisphaerales bacterium]
MDRHRILVVFVVAVALAALLFVRMGVVRRPPTQNVAPPQASDRGVQYVGYTTEVMSTLITVRVPEHQGEEAAEVVFNVFRDIDARMSEWKETSPLSQVNRAAGEGPVRVPDDLRALIRRGTEIGDLTGGAFDITWAALWGLWDFTAERPEVPDDDEIDRRLALIDYRCVEIDEEAGTVFLPEKGMVLGLGGIAKGHALDRAAAALKARGIDSFLISAGGQMMAGGMKGDRPWRVGIRDPRGDPEDYFAHLEVADTSVSTSGDYERYFVLDDVRYHHILDPRRGRPARGLRSATVVSSDATLADALSTALMILGRDAALELVESLDGVEAVLVDDEAKIHLTSGLTDRMTVVRPPEK